MAKGHSKKLSIVPSNNGNYYREFVTSRGVSVRLVGLPPMLAENLQAKYDRMLPKTPQYSITTVAGDVEWHDHNETTLEVEGDEVETAKNKEMWQEYISKVSAIEDKKSESMLRMILLKGVINVVVSEEWKSEAKFIGMDIPEDPTELRYEYIRNEVLGSPADLASIVQTVMEMTGVPEEKLQEAEDMFQRKIQAETSERSVGKTKSKG